MKRIYRNRYTQTEIQPQRNVEGLRFILNIFRNVAFDSA